MITDKMVEAALAEFYLSDADDVHSVMRDALEAAEAGAWEPIETAPKSLLSGVLLWGGQRKSTADWTETMYPIATPVIGWFDKMDRVWVIGNGDSHDDRIIAVAPTHWRPLPTPPAR